MVFLGDFGKMMFGSKDKAKRFQQYSPEQMQGMQQLWQALSGGGGQFGDMFGQFNPEQTADVFNKGVGEPAMRNFQQQVIPGIMESFGDQGASSALSNSLAGAGSDLQSNLSAQLEMFMQQARMQNQQNRMGGMQMLSGMNPYQTYVQRGNEGLMQSAAQGFGRGAGMSAGMGMF